MNLFSFTLIFTLPSLVFINVYADTGRIETTANELGKQLSEMLNDATGYPQLSGKISSAITAKKLDSSAIENDITNLTKLFNDRLNIAKEMVEYASSVHANYTNDNNLDESYEYSNAVDGIESKLHDDAEFPFPVTLNDSAVQTPTDLYQYTSEILNSIEWTKKLNQEFEKNYDEVKAWQYIGLSNGVFRFYPGRHWPNGSDGSMQYYDVRQRSWYIEGSSPPKDMIILLDLSGSVIGNRLLIIKSAVIKLLDTLQENDFVNIIYFNKNARYLKKCWERLVQATARNKKILKDAVLAKSVKGENVADVETGFEKAFQALKAAGKNYANCTQTIAFFTDGVEGDTVAEGVFDKYNADKRIRVFTYLVGRDSGSPFEAVKWIACNNKGYFYRIETLSDVRQKIVKYVSVLSRSTSKDPKWTPLQFDALGLGMITSVVVPIFDEKTKKQLGVFGSDVKLDKIVSSIPESHLGAGGYAFSITNNGLVFFHPMLKKEEGAGLKHPISIFISDLLYHFNNINKTKELAADMIKRNTKNLSSEFDEYLILAKYNDKFRIVKRNLTYSYEPIENTSFSVGVAMTNYGSKVINTSGDNSGDINDALQNLTDQNISHTLGENWPYCSDDSKELNHCEANPKDTDLLNRARCDIRKLGLNSVWNPIEPNSTFPAIFFGTTSGLTFYKTLENLTFHTSIKQEYFERAADNCLDKRIIFSASNKDQVNVSRAVVGKDKVLWGVVGIFMNSTVLNDKLKSKCGADADEDTLCYLVDENGYIVSSSEEGKNGQFFGAVEGSVMEDVINKSVYVKYNFTDVQAMCESPSDESSSSVRLLDPVFSLVNYAKWWTQTIALSLIQYSLYTVMTGTNQVKAEDSDGPYPCYKKIDLFYREYNGNSGNGMVEFSGCNRSYEYAEVLETNLLLIIVNVTNSTYCKSKTNKMTTEEEDNYEGSCELVEHDRVPAETCSAVNERESQECSSGKLLIPSMVFLALLQIMFLMLQEE